MSRAGRGRQNRPIVLQRQNQLGQTLGAKGFETRRRLLAATSELLDTVPLTELRVSQIVRQAKTSPGTFYVYFNDVYEVVLDLVGEITQSPPKILNLLAEPWASGRALEAAHEFVSIYIEHCQVHAALFRVRNLAADEGDKRFLRVRLAAVAPLIQAMTACVERRKAAGWLPNDLDPRSAACTLLAMVERLAVLRYSPLIRVTSGQLLDVAAFFAALLLAEGPIDLGRALSAEPATLNAAPDLSSGSRRPETPVSPAPILNLHGQTIGAKGAKTRQKLIEATTELLGEKPLLDISVNDIARRAKTSTSVFWLYFRDVEDVVLAGVANLTQSTPELLQILAEPWTAANRAELSERFVASYIRHWHANRALFRVRNVLSDEGNLDFVNARYDAIRPVLELMTAKIAARQKSGGGPRHLHPAAAAAGFLAMVERLSITPNIGLSQGVTVDSIARAAAYFQAALILGVQPLKVITGDTQAA